MTDETPQLNEAAPLESGEIPKMNGAGERANAEFQQILVESQAAARCPVPTEEVPDPLAELLNKKN